MKHEVTAAHTRSLFCSLQLFLSPLTLMVAIPTVHKNSSSVAAQQESHALFFSFSPNSCSLTLAYRVQRLAQRKRQLRANPSLSPRALRTPLFGDTQCSAAAACRAESRSLTPPPAPSVLGARAAYFACRVRSSSFAPPQDCPASPQYLES